MQNEDEFVLQGYGPGTGYNIQQEKFIFFVNFIRFHRIHTTLTFYKYWTVVIISISPSGTNFTVRYFEGLLTMFPNSILTLI